MSNTTKVALYRRRRACYNKKDVRGSRHRFIWQVCLTTEDFDSIKVSPVSVRAYRTRKEAQRVAKTLRALLDSGLSYDEVRDYFIKGEPKDFYIMLHIVRDPYEEPDYSNQVLLSKWMYIRQHLSQDALSRDLYLILSSTDEETSELSTPAVDALVQLGARLDYVAENGESSRGAALRTGVRTVLKVLDLK